MSGRVAATSGPGDEHELVNRSRGQHGGSSLQHTDGAGSEYSGEQLLEKRSRSQQSSTERRQRSTGGVQTGRQGEHGAERTHGFGHGDALYFQHGDVLSQTGFDTGGHGEHGIARTHGFGHGDALYFQHGDVLSQTGFATGGHGEHGIARTHGFGHGDALYFQHGDFVSQTADFDTCQPSTSTAADNHMP